MAAAGLLVAACAEPPTPASEPAAVGHSITSATIPSPALPITTQRAPCAKSGGVRSPWDDGQCTYTVTRTVCVEGGGRVVKKSDHEECVGGMYDGAEVL